MKFIETPLQGLYVIELELLSDERGYFARAFCRDEFTKHGLDANVVQCNISYNKKAGTLRGLHYQRSPHAEDKFVRCVTGSIFDVAVDIRIGSSTYKRWFGIELTEKNGKALYVPKGFAHGYLTLMDETTVYYQVSEGYHPEKEQGIYYGDEAIGIEWPFVSDLIVSEKDRKNPCLL